MLVAANAWFLCPSNYIFVRFCKYFTGTLSKREGRATWHRERGDSGGVWYAYISNVYFYDAVLMSQRFWDVFNVLFMQCWIVLINTCVYWRASLYRTYCYWFYKVVVYVHTQVNKLEEMSFVFCVWVQRSQKTNTMRWKMTTNITNRMKTAT